MNPRVIAIDPGYDRVGIAIVSKIDHKEVLEHSECFSTDKQASLDERIQVIGNHIGFLIRKHEPVALAIETVFFATNQKTVMGVSEARGVIKYVAMQSGILVHEYTPLQVKIALTGDGRATKDSVAYMTEKIIQFDRPAKLAALGGKSTGIDDELDAIAIGITYFAHSQGPHNVKIR
jgi:crossover junction endodeoxyribonuclease RuvC